ncbi:short transient receptor potential channel 2-like [Protopterus annectens]|uniref:short transient receptor potential channel 2-like n=1 Tax=Protopterus annectens TaxID=7888 RepID=UPI001CFC26DC|nr:short transient receptor potential channel 2-like [Protopterus annectens]
MRHLVYPPESLTEATDLEEGNSGSAFVQIEVARSSWPLDKPYVMFLPNTTLMTPADSKLGKNRTGVRMFKEGDFLSPAVTEKWDRIRITCSQPFNKYAQFGLSFIQIRTPLDGGSECAALNPNQQHHAQHPAEKSELSSSPWLCNPAIQRTFFAEAQVESPSEQQLKNRLHQMDPNSASRLGNKVCLSRTAKMVISAAQSRCSRNIPLQSGESPSVSKRISGVSENAEQPSNLDRTNCIVGSVNGLTMVTPSQGSTVESKSRKRSWGNKSLTRSPASGSRGASLKKKRLDLSKPQNEPLTRKLQETNKGDDQASRCPICGVLFTNSYLPLHASRCGDDYGSREDVSDDDEPIIVDVCSSSRESSPFVPCPLCGFHFSVTEIERHASTCGEAGETIDASPSWTWIVFQMSDSYSDSDVEDASVKVDDVAFKCITCMDVKKCIAYVNMVIYELQLHGDIDIDLFNYLTVSCPVTPQLYGIPKIHKSMTDPPMRPIVSGAGWVTEPISIYLHGQLQPFLIECDSILQDTIDFLQKLKVWYSVGKVDLAVKRYYLVTLDIVSLFTVIPIDAGIDLLREFLASCPNPDFGKIENICSLMDVILKNNVFLFDDSLYLQLTGVAMGTSVANTYANLAANWREIVNKKMKFPPSLHSAISEGNLNQVCRLVQSNDGILRQLDDSEDRSWREALNLAIRLGYTDITKTLVRCVKFDFRQIHEALLVAVDTNQPQVVKLLLDRLDQEKGFKVDIKSFSLAIFDNSIDNSSFAPGVTPLTLACEKDLYEIVDMLIKKGHSIPTPHKISCSCLECSNGRKYDLLKFSLSRINTYKGIASRAYLSIASEDAMLTAFKLSREMKQLSKKEPEFKPEYLALVELSQDFAVELLGMCRNQSEVTAVLNDIGDSNEEDNLDDQAFEEGIPNLARLRLAVNYNQKRFVAHPICQQVLSSIWCRNLSGWRGSNTLWKLVISVVIFLLMPMLCLLYWVAPKSKLGKMLKIPVIKFLLHAASYVWFLIFLLAESLLLEYRQEAYSSRKPTLWENSFHMIWVVGFLWFECKEVWIEGLRSYLFDWWNFLDMVILSMYLASFTLRVLVALQGYFSCFYMPSSEQCYYFTKADREDWRPEDPQFIAEVLFAVTSMLSFTRLAYILPAHETLGTMQISIGKMIDDMIRFMFILMIILTAFLCGLNNIYVHYAASERLGTFNETLPFLFWTMFGMENYGAVNMSKYAVAGYVGQILYGIYTIVMVIILLNMLIAMITNSFQKIEDDADVEWKFARSKLYLNYFREGLTLPVPFNVIPTPKAIFYMIRGFFRVIFCCKKSSQNDYPPLPHAIDDGMRAEGKETYRLQVIKTLVQRYIDTARREFEEAKRKDLGNRITELTKSVNHIHTEIKHLKHYTSESTPNDPAKDGANILSHYISRVRSGFHSYGDDGSISSDSGTRGSLQVMAQLSNEETGGLDDECPPYPEEYSFNKDIATSPTESKMSEDTDTGISTDDNSPDYENSPTWEEEEPTKENTTENQDETT